VKVIKKGRQQKGWAKQITCTGKGHGRGGCGAVLLIEESDLLRGERWVMGRDHEVWVYFVCSECGVKSEVNNYPGDVYKLATHKSLADVTEPETKRCPGCDGSCPPGNCYNRPA
jgi:hypothetical protein